jgi:hypothetical protein
MDADRGRTGDRRGGRCVAVCSFLQGFGHLPGDIVIERENFRFYFPPTTCILLSLVASALAFAIARFRRQCGGSAGFSD